MGGNNCIPQCCAVTQPINLLCEGVEEEVGEGGRTRSAGLQPVGQTLTSICSKSKH